LREGAEDSSWEPFSSPPPDPFGDSPPSSEAIAAERSTSSIRTSLRSPTKRPPPVTLTM
jgi:hypothetical protein